MREVFLQVQTQQRGFIVYRLLCLPYLLPVTLVKQHVALVRSVELLPVAHCLVAKSLSLFQVFLGKALLLLEGCQHVLEVIVQMDMTDMLSAQRTVLRVFVIKTVAQLLDLLIQTHLHRSKPLGCLLGNLLEGLIV